MDKLKILLSLDFNHIRVVHLICKFPDSKNKERAEYMRISGAHYSTHQTAVYKLLAITAEDKQRHIRDTFGQSIGQLNLDEKMFSLDEWERLWAEKIAEFKPPPETVKVKREFHLPPKPKFNVPEPPENMEVTEEPLEPILKKRDSGIKKAVIIWLVAVFSFICVGLLGSLAGGEAFGSFLAIAFFVGIIYMAVRHLEKKDDSSD